MDTGADVISGLPDDVLINILSRLSTKEAVRTSILSSRWKNLWKWIYNLDFSIESEEKYEQCAPIYIQVLRLLRSPNIQSISLVAKAPSSVNDADFNEYVGKWVDFAETHNVSELYFDLKLSWEWEKRITIPRSVFTCTSLVKLTLKSDWKYHFDVPEGSMYFPSVKTLDILFVIDNDSDFNKLRSFFHHCPVLEDLSLDIEILYHGHGKGVIFELMLPALKRLRIYENRDDIMESGAPNIHREGSGGSERTGTQSVYPFDRLQLKF